MIRVQGMEFALRATFGQVAGRNTLPYTVVKCNLCESLLLIDTPRESVRSATVSLEEDLMAEWDVECVVVEIRF